MKTTLSIQQTNQRHGTRYSRIRSIALWALQVLLALLFLFAGSMKLLIPFAEMQAQMPIPLSETFLHFIGVAECAGALGLLLPGILRIQRRLTPLAACGLILIMTGATVITLLGGQGAAALMPLLIGLLCTLVAFGRRSWFAVA